MRLWILLLLCGLLAFPGRASGDEVPAAAASSAGAEAAGPTTEGAEGAEGEETPGEPPAAGDKAEPRELDPLPPSRDEFSNARIQNDLSSPPTQTTLGRGVRPRPWLVLRPLLRFSAFYTDNVRRSAEDEEDDVELSTTLTLNLAATRRRYSVEFGYTLINRTFVDADDLDSLDQVLSGRLDLALKRTMVGINLTLGRLTRPEDPVLQGGEARRWASTGGLNIRTQLSRYLGLLVEGSSSYLDFEDRRSGSDQIGLGGNVFLTSPVPRGTLQLGGGYRELRYLGAERVNPDLGVLNVTLGYAFQWRRLSGQVRVGYELSRLIERRLYPRNADLPDGMIASANLEWLIRRPTRIQLTASRQITLGAGNLGAQTTTRATLGWVEQLTPTLRSIISGSFERQEPELAGEVDSLTVSGVLEWTPTPWLVVGGQASFQRVKRDLDGGEFQTLRLGVSVSLRL